jgi:hypothetical protein
MIQTQAGTLLLKPTQKLDYGTSLLFHPKTETGSMKKHSSTQVQVL